MPKRVYDFEEGNRSLTALLGGKGANLSEMTRIGMPVPHGFTITTGACKEYLATGDFPAGLMEEVEEHLLVLQRQMGKKLDDDTDPLLVSVRSGAPVSMPGMMETVLDVGLNDSSVKRFAFDSYRRLIQMFGSIVMGIERVLFEDALLDIKEHKDVVLDTELDASDLEYVVDRFEEVFEEGAGRPFPQAPHEQLRLAIRAVFDSWMGRKAKEYRRIHRLSEGMGTAVNVQAMVFGNKGDDSGTGVAFTRDPSTGAQGTYGDYLQNAQGEDVVSGVRTPVPLAELEELQPQSFHHLRRIMIDLERHYRDMCDIEFTIEQGKLWMLQTRVGKRTAAASLRIAEHMEGEGLISRREAVLRIDPESLDQLLHRRLDPDTDVALLCTGVNASPGAAVGRVVFDSDIAVEWVARGEKVILVREMTEPDDIHGMAAAEGILTSAGGKTSHAAVVARGMGKPCVCGAGDVQVDLAGRRFTVADTVVSEGDVITVDGTGGKVILGRAPLIEPEPGGSFRTVLSWADTFRHLGVRANADTGGDAKRARDFGAEGIGLCRTEHMFMGDRLPVVQRMILASVPAEEKAALDELGRVQREDFEAVLEAMDGMPVTVRLLDPPLHEFLPSEDEAEGAMLHAVRSWREANPMLGLRGCRLGFYKPGLYEMQTRALFQAAASRVRAGGHPVIEVMIPLVAEAEELKRMRSAIERVIGEVLEAENLRETGDLEWSVGTMVETPRAALTAADVAAHADFFSFGTNDLTQFTYAFSRDDVEKRLLPRYLEAKVLPENPFELIDERGVGRLIEWALLQGRTARPDLKVGVCGEHGGDPRSVAFFHRLGVDYVSCSPFRVPVARLAAAHAALREQGETGGSGTE